MNDFLIHVLISAFLIYWFGDISAQGDQDTLLPQSEIVYKTIDSIELAMQFFLPADYHSGRKYPAIIFYHGGGWRHGNTKQFENQARHFASRGMIAIRAEYRLESLHGTTPFEAVKDARTAMRFLKENAGILQIDTTRIAASGGSAGGHLAAATAILKGLDEDTDNLSVSPQPGALILFNPVIDNGPEGYGYDRIGERYPEISPFHNIRKGTPPTLFMIGTDDRLIPVQTAKAYRKKIEAAGSRCDLRLYEDQTHGFFNYGKEFFTQTLEAADSFLVSLRYIDKKSKTKQADLREIIIASEKIPVLIKAERYMSEKPASVTDWVCERSAGGPNDFYSEGDYWWPDPDNPGGPYIRKDGLSNPGNFSEHRYAMIQMSKITGTMASAYLLTGNNNYAEKAMEHLRVWFINETTRMNPNLLYAQAIQGRHTGRGIGIIDALHLVEPALAIKAIESSPAVYEKELVQLKKWFSDFLDWISTHEYGKAEMIHPNNHGTSWALQAAAYAWLSGNHKMLDFCASRYKYSILPAQMGKDGSFPLELERTKPYGYSIFNLDVISSLVQILGNAGYNLYSYETDDGRSLKVGIEFLYPYIRNKEEWPYTEDVLYFDEYPVRQSFLLFGGLAYYNPEYIRTWLTLDGNPEHPEVVRNTVVKNSLLWLNIEPPLN